ncbi:Rieske 2Fe-2S domain-containing protein [Streptomyces sp. NPDC127079]|uniref:Rieske 2Fe-2S domain-containing protein n=1 Tax=Streptomyces sp. NPDC127079 TaxID=3347132 RepID=UPI0036539186
MTVTSSDLDTGTGYGRPAPQHDARLTEVGPGTPMGEAMRRYWHPVATSSGLTSDLPHRTRILGEDLIVFRTRGGRPGVVFERCAHRGSSLFYGRVEEDGIRCCYHGWKFDVEGNCLEQACEPDRGRRRDVARQPWYPVEERYGLVFVYMGPPEHKPPLPRYEFFEDLEEGESFFTELPVPGEQKVTGLLQEFNWLQGFENTMDPVHVTWLHYAHSGAQFEGVGTTGMPEEFYNPYTVSGKIDYAETEYGMSVSHRAELDKPYGSIFESHLPNLFLLPNQVTADASQRHDCLIWAVPSDDTSHRSFIAIRAKSFDRMLQMLGSVKQNGKMNWELTEEEKQRFPGDFESQNSQGAITLHSEETLATSDKGVVMLRRMLRRMVDDVEAGRDPQNVERGEAKPRTATAGYILDEPEHAPAATPASS